MATIESEWRFAGSISYWTSFEWVHLSDSSISRGEQAELHEFFHRKPYLGAAAQSFSIGMSGWWAFNFSTISLTLIGRRLQGRRLP
jgi:hypothetical protein